MKIDHGIFTVSLDFELYWGIRDVSSIQDYQENLKGVPKVIEIMLELFEEYEVHATWATVGFLFAQDGEELKKTIPTKIPNYNNPNFNPYLYITNNNTLESCYHFAPHLIDKIHNHKNQEIGTHTFSHYYCLEEGQSKEEFSSDIEAAIMMAKNNGISIKSLVFPRNQWDDEYLSVLNKHGIVSYRGNPKGWIYRASSEADEKLIKRALRLIDSYINLTGSNSYSLKSISTTKPFNIQSSYFLRSKIKGLSALENIRKKRITNGLRKAAKHQEVFHLWWHPHNFGANIDENIEFLTGILSYFHDMKNKYGMTSLNMGEISTLIQAKSRHEQN